jgi:hypothetical protein
MIALACCTTSLRAQVKLPYSSTKWTEAYKDDSVVVAFDPTDLKKNSDGSYTLRMRWVYTKDHHIESGSQKREYRSLVERKMILCNPIRTKNISSTAYGADGKVVSAMSPLSAAELQSMDWFDRKPNSSAGKALIATCSKIK